MESLAFVVCNALALLAAWGLTRALLPGDRGFSRLVATLAALPAVVIPTLIILGNVGLLTPLASGTVLAVLAALLHALAPASTHAEISTSKVVGSPSMYVVTGAILALLTLQAVSFVQAQLLTGWRPQWDDLSYHAPMAAHWLQAERLVLAPYHYHAYYPGNGELFAVWFMLASKLDAYASLTGAYWMLLCGFCAVQLSRRLGCNPACAALSGATLMACKPFWQHAGSFAAVDLAGTATACAAITFATPTTPDPSGTKWRGRAWFVGSLFGVAVGCKVTFAPIAVLTFGYMLLELRPNAKEGLRILGIFGGAALLCGGFYYARNAWLTGNPLFPAAVFGFEGPLDASARQPTSMLYQLRHIGPDLLAQTWSRLLGWPSAVAYGLISAYALTFAASLWPRTYQHAAQRLLVFLLLGGLLALFVSAAGPFSGTENARHAHLSVRLRFFLPTVLFAIPLAAYWAQRIGRGTPWVAGVCATGLAMVSGEPWQWLSAFALIGAGSAWTLLRHTPRVSTTALRMVTVAALVVIPSAAAWAMSYKQPENDRVMHTVFRAWNALDDVPSGSRIAWFSTFEGYKYYRAFGRKLRLVPVPVGSDGTRMLFMHEYWRQYNPTWWVSLSSPDNPSGLMENLRARHVTHVLLMKRHGGPWAEQREVLSKARGVRLMLKRDSVMLFEIH